MKAERRECNRFQLPGATLTYRLDRKLFKSPGFSDGYLPIHDISLGGVRYLSQTSPRLGARIVLEIYLPDNGRTFTIKGVVVWASDYPGDSYDYLIGVQFNPYGDKKEFNAFEILASLKELEQQHS